MGQWGDVTAFLSAVVPWPVNQTGYVNLHYSLPNPRDPKGKNLVTGKPYQTLDQYVNFVQWALRASNFKDMWFCTSLQSTAGVNSKGNPKAMRSSANAMGLKAVWIDCDIRPDDKSGQHYTTMQDAWAAFIAFYTKVGLPPPSAVVKTGGGLHIYWINDTLMTSAEWEPYSHGLKALLLRENFKCDYGLTTDNCRLLRVPNTFNHKYDPPRQVQLTSLPLTIYKFETALAMLPPEAHIAAMPSHKATLANTVDYGGAFQILPVFKSVACASLAQGIHENMPLDGGPILLGCKFLGNALSTGGRDYDNPKWLLTTLASTFMEKGEEIAHALANQHKGYTPESTHELYERKLMDRAQRDLGYPTCAAVEGAGFNCKAACPFYGRVKSPLNIRPELTAAVTPLSIVAQKQQLTIDWMPKGYMLDEKGIVCYVKSGRVDRKGNPLQDLLFPLFMCKISAPDAVLERGADALTYTVTVDKGNTHRAYLKSADFGSSKLKSVLMEPACRTKYINENSQYIPGFFMALLDKLHELRKASNATTYGWYYDDEGKRTGFVYGGVLHHRDGNTSPVAAQDARLATSYRPRGTTDKWHAAAKCITDQKRPELNALIAMAFASPLLPLEGHDGATMAIHGMSGSQKSSAMNVGLAVWGNWHKTREDTRATENGITQKMGQLVNLPIYWDEIKDDTTLRKVMNTLFTATGGIDKTHLTSNRLQGDRGSWQLMMCTSANTSLVDFIERTNPGHDAAINRIFEYEITPTPANAPGKTSDTVATRLITDLQHNYGGIGMEYAGFLAQNADAIDAEVKALALKVEADLNVTESERYWKAVVTCVLQGAIYATKLGVEIDCVDLKNFLYDAYLRQRNRRAKAAVVAGTADNTEQLLSDYFKVRLMDNTLWCSGAPVLVTGRPKAGSVTVLHEPKDQGFRGQIQVRFNLKERQLLISKSDFLNWLVNVQKNPAQTAVMRGLVSNYGMVETRMVLAAGTRWRTLQEKVMVLTIQPDTDMDDVLHSYAGGLTAGVTAPVTTGITTATSPTP